MAIQPEAQPKSQTRRTALERYHQRLLFAVVMAMIALLFLANLVTRSREFSETENRGLAQRPGISSKGLKDGSFFDDFDTYYSDQFVLRDQFFKTNYTGNRLLHIREMSGVLVGKANHQFEEPVTPDSDLEKATTDRINEFHSAHEGIKTRVMVVPGSAAVLTDKLPANAPVANQTKDIADFYGQLDEGIETIDVSSVLKKADHDNLYYKTDHHWTSNGAYTAFNGAAEQLGIDAPVKYDHYKVSTSFRGTLTSKTGDFSGKDTVEIYAPKDSKVRYYVVYPSAGEKRASIYKPEMLDTKDQYTVFFGGNYPLVEINTTADNGRNLLVLKHAVSDTVLQPDYHDRPALLL